MPGFSPALFFAIISFMTDEDKKQNENIQNKLNLLNARKKKFDKSRSLCAFLFCIFLFDWNNFMSGDPNILLIFIYVVITLVPLGLIVYESLLIKKIKNQIQLLNGKLFVEDDSSES